MMNSPGSPGLRIIVHRPGDGYTGIDKRLGPERIGTETYRVLETPEFDAAHKRLIDAGVRFRSDVRTEPWAKEAAFEDLYGNHLGAAATRNVEPVCAKTTLTVPS